MRRLAIATMFPAVPRGAAFAPAPVTRTTDPGDVALPAGLGTGDITARFVIVALFSIMVFRLGSDFLQTGRIAGLLLLASEGLVVILTVFRRPAGAVDRSVKARTLMVISLIGPILVSPASASVPDTPAGICDGGDFGRRPASWSSSAKSRSDAASA